ncbi:MAG: ABC transporter substrate-binding protein, partial [Bacteroidota bacterium]
MMTQRTHTRWTALALTGLLGVLAACGGPQDPAEQRAQRIAQSDGPILIGAAWPWEARTSGYYWEGLELAVREVNEAGGIQGRPIELVREDDRESVNEGRLVAQRLANNPDVVAVIGHLNSHVTLPAAGTYEAAGLVMLTPASTTPELTEKGYRRIFRSVNNDVMIGQQMVDYAVSKGYTNVAIAYVRNAYGLGLANAFERRAIEAGVHIVDRQAYDSAVRDTRVSFDRIIDEWKDRRFDAIFLAGMAPEAGYFVKHVRAAGIDASMFGGDALDTQSLIESAGPAAEGLVVASIFHPDNPRPEVQQFNEVFSTA